MKDIIELGTHDMFIGEVVCTSVDDAYLDENGRLDLQKADLIAYSHGEYYRLGKKIGKFGFLYRRKSAKRKKKSFLIFSFCLRNFKNYQRVINICFVSFQ